MATLNLQQNFTRLYGVNALPALDEIFLDEYKVAEDPRPFLFNMESTDRELVQKQGISSLGVFAATSEAEIAPKDSFNQNYRKNFSIVKYAKSIGISREMIMDDRHDLISKMVKSLARSAMETQLLSAFNLFNNGFGSATAWDDVAWFSASHPSEVGNQSNLITAADLSYTTLREMLVAMRSQKDQRGKRLLQLPKILLVSESDRHLATELVKSPYKPGVADNNINSSNIDGQLAVVSSPYLTDTDATFLLTDPMYHGARIITREDVVTDIEEDRRAQVMYYVASYRQVQGIDQWRGAFGNAGV